MPLPLFAAVVLAIAYAFTAPRRPEPPLSPDDPAVVQIETLNGELDALLSEADILLAPSTRAPDRVRPFAVRAALLTLMSSDVMRACYAHPSGVLLATRLKDSLEKRERLVQALRDLSRAYPDVRL